MTQLLYITADKVGDWTGGGQVTRHEWDALKELDPSAKAWGREQLDGPGMEPWKWDDRAWTMEDFFVTRPRLAHFYSGSFPKTVAQLKRQGCKVTYTIAAHDKEISRREHEQVWGIPFAYPHLVEPELWKRYIEGYRLADVIICPSSHSAGIVRRYGPEFRDKDIRIIPHGCTLPERPKTPLPKRFTVGYLGAIGPDKGLIYLLRAWKKLGWDDATLLFAGKDSKQPIMSYLLTRPDTAIWSYNLAGWVENVSDFYDAISLYIQPSATEGFGLEVLEAMAHGRDVICSENAGAADLVPTGQRFKACDVDDLANAIHGMRYLIENDQEGNTIRHARYRAIAQGHTWDKIKQDYQKVWRELLK